MTTPTPGDELHPNARRVVEAAAAAGLAIEVVEYPEGTRTAAERQRRWAAR